MNEIVKKALNTVKFYTDKRFSTIAGTLVYFFLMSITPFLLWLTIILGNVDMSKLLNHRLLEGARPVLHSLKSAAENAAGSGASLIFLLTSLYSSTNFFYHLRRSGEIIYESSRVKGGIKLRLLSFLLIIAAIAMIALLGGVSVIGSTFLELFLPSWASDSISLLFITALALGAALVLNIFACPRKIKPSQAITGSLLTCALWLIFGFGFGVYLKFASPEKLYGKIASAFVFLLWCYIMMCCFVLGIIDNRKYFAEKRSVSKDFVSNRLTDGNFEKNKEPSLRKALKKF